MKILPIPMDPTPDEVERFLAKLRGPTDDGCMIWTAAIKDDGYGVFWLRGRLYRAHRLACAWTTGIDPGDLVPDHTCRNRACCASAHLEPVTQGENIMRSYAAGQRIPYLSPEEAYYLDRLTPAELAAV